MSRFKNIDDKLAALATKLNAQLTKDRPGYPEVLRTFEERRIDWRDGEMLKAIIIQPTFEHKGVDQEIWNFIGLAWWPESDPGAMYQWREILVDKLPFEVIENNIDSLLTVSEENLLNIRMEDLKVLFK
jgi:hypothetical protein